MPGGPAAWGSLAGRRIGPFKRLSPSGWWSGHPRERWWGSTSRQETYSRQAASQAVPVLIDGRQGGPIRLEIQLRSTGLIRNGDTGRDHAATSVFRLLSNATHRRQQGETTRGSRPQSARLRLSGTRSRRRPWRGSSDGSAARLQALRRAECCRRRSKTRPFRRSKTRPPVRRVLVCRVLGSDAGQGVDPAVA